MVPTDLTPEILQAYTDQQLELTGQKMSTVIDKHDENVSKNKAKKKLDPTVFIVEKAERDNAYEFWKKITAEIRRRSR